MGNFSAATAASDLRMNHSPEHQAALDFIWSRIDYERTAVIPYGQRTFRLDRMRNLLARLGQPDQGMPIVHIAGTKGKGSTSAMVASMLQAAGLRVGLFSSPHLDCVEERFRINGQPCTPEQLVQLIETLRPVVAEMDRGMAAGPTYFELTTALALLHFAQQSVDAAVLEVGLGGRLDSTNVCQSTVTAITSISFDHTKQLGNTLAAIAREKAGIIKPGVPLVCGVTSTEPQQVIEEVCRSTGAPLWQLQRDFDFAYEPPNMAAGSSTGATPWGRMHYLPGPGLALPEMHDLELGLLGRHQAANGAVALTIAAQLIEAGWNLPELALRAGLRDVRWPARVEVVETQPTVLLDAAHNVASIKALVETLEESFPGRGRILVFATSKDKDVRGMLEALLPRFEQVIFTQYLNNPRAVPPETLLALASELSAAQNGQASHSPKESASQQSPWPECRMAATPQLACEMLRGLQSAEALTCVCGSFFLAGEMRHQLQLQPRLVAPVS